MTGRVQPQQQPVDGAAVPGSVGNDSAAGVLAAPRLLAGTEISDIARSVRAIEVPASSTAALELHHAFEEEFAVESSYGTHLTLQIVDVRQPRRLDETAAVSDFLRNLVRRIGMNILAGPLVTRDDGPPERSGCSGVVILHESHAAIHTYPHLASAFVDVFSCRPFDVAEVSRVLQAHFGSHQVAEQGLTDRGRHWTEDVAAELGGWRLRR